MGSVPILWTAEVGRASLDIRRVGNVTASEISEEAAGPGEFSILRDCYCQDGVIRPRRRLVRVASQPGSRRILSMADFRNGESRDTWLLVSWLDTGESRHAGPTALLTSRSGNVMSVTVKREGHRAAPAGMPWAFWTYRNQSWASNLLRSQVFDGRLWSSLNGTTDLITGVVVTSEVAARLGGVAEGKMFFANTPCYADEVAYADTLVELPVTTKWAGTAPGGGTGVGVILYGLAAPSTAYGMFACGGGGTVIRATSEGAAWYNLPSPSVASFNAIDLLLSNTDDLDGFVVGSSYLTGEKITQNAWWLHYDSPQSEPTFTREVMSSLRDIFCLVIDPEYAASTDPWHYAIAGGCDSANAMIKHWNGTMWVGAVYTTHAGAKVRGVCVIHDGSSYHRYACGTYDNSSNGVMMKRDTVVANRWDDIAAFPDLTGTSVDLYGLHGYGTGGQHTLYVVGGISGAGKVYRYQSDGAWATLTMPVGYTNHTPQAVLALSRTTVYVVGERGLIMKSTDSGASWTVQTSGVAVQLNRIVNFDTGDANKLAVVGDGGVYLYTNDGGTVWIEAGKGENNPNKLATARRLGAGESIQAKHQRSGMLNLFTNRGIRVLDEATMKPQFRLDGFETFNDNCIAEFRGMIVALGCLNGTPGVYGWDGSATPPRLLSERITGLFRSSPGNNYIPCLRCIPDTSDHAWDSEDDFRPRYDATSPGWAFDERYWAWENGLMVMRVLPANEAWTFVYSHGISKGEQAAGEHANSGIYVPNVSDWGFVAFDYSLNHPAAEGLVQAIVYVRSAVTSDMSAATWTRLGDLPHTGQGALLGRVALRLGPDIVPATNKWLQVRIQCINHATSEFNFVINRMVVRAFTDTDDSTLATAPAPPSLVVHDDKIYASFSVDTVTGTPRYQARTVVLSGEALQASTIDTGLEVGCCRVVDDELMVGFFGRDAALLENLAFMPEDSRAVAAGMSDAPITQELRFFIDFADGARARTLVKDLLRIHLSGRPVNYAGSSTVTLRWAADRISALSTGEQMTFSRLHVPENAMYRHHTLNVAKADENGNSRGRRFHFVLTASQPFILEALSVEARVRTADYATAYGS